MSEDISSFVKGWRCLDCLLQIDGTDQKTYHEHQDHKIIEDNLQGNQIKEFIKLKEENHKTGIVFAHNPRILESIQKDLNIAHVGDDKNKILATILLASSKRKGHEQGVIIQKQSSAGGSNLQNTCLEYFDDKIVLTRMTAAYIDRSGTDYTGKILAIGELSGFDSSSSSLRQKLSEVKSQLATTDRDEKGKITTNILLTEGRPTFITTTTSEEIHPELENRCWILSIDETSKQTKSVNRRQFSKDTFEYQPWKPRQEIKAYFNSGILKDLNVVNPFSHILGENFPCDSITARRDSKRFSELITTITFMHQYQRIKIIRKGQTHIITSYEDIQHALDCAEDSLKNTLNKLNEKDEAVLAYMKSSLDKSITRNQLVNALNIPYETLKRILTKLVNRSFLELTEEDRTWKYSLTSKAMINGIALAPKEEFEKSAIEYLTKNAGSFEKIILPPNYESMKGVDAEIVTFLLSFGDLVTIENAPISGMTYMPVTTLPDVQETGTNSIEKIMPVTNQIE